MVDLNKSISEIEEKLSKVSDAWQHYFLEYNACKRKINFNDEVRTNYVADIFIYLRDTLPFLLETGKEENSMKNVFNAFGVLQSIYVQQDLIDELLYIFKIQKSKNVDKSINRQLRNELIGHPISRRNGELISSVFLRWGFPSNGVNYILYNYQGSFKNNVVDHKWIDILTRHFAFLNSFLDEIWRKVTSILRLFQKDLIHLKELIKKIEFKKILDLTEQRFEILLRNNDAYEKDFLFSCDQQESTHKRFAYLKGMFLSELAGGLKETINSVDELLNDGTKSKTERFEPIDIIFVKESSLSKEEIKKIQEDSAPSYDFGKLLENHPVFGISYFMERYGSDSVIMAELEIMKANFGKPLFACSYEYLKYYMQKKVQ